MFFYELLIIINYNIFVFNFFLNESTQCEFYGITLNLYFFLKIN